MIVERQPIPEQLTVAVGERVAFMNHDRTAYTIVEGQQAVRSDCPEINIGVLAGGDTRTTEAFTTAKTCTFQASSGGPVLLTGQIIVR